MLLSFLRYLNPKAHKYLASSNSGFVPLFLLLAFMHFLRCSGVNLSIADILFKQ